MDDQFLTTIVCLPILIILMTIVAVLGIRSRIKLANRLFKIHKERNIEGKSKFQKLRIRRVFYGLAFLSIISIPILGILMITRVLSYSILWINIFLLIILYLIIFSIGISWNIKKLD